MIKIVPNQLIFIAIDLNKLHMNNKKQSSDEQNVNLDLEDSSGMNAHQQAIFLNISRSKSADSFLGKILPHLNEVPDRDRSLVFDPPMHSFTHNIILSRPPNPLEAERSQMDSQVNGLRLFKKIKKEKVRNKCDYDKNICGYITKKVIREFVSKSYEQEVVALAKKYKCSLSECRSFYLKKVEYVTGPSHLPELLNPLPEQPPSISGCKRAFREFYRWFLKERYLRYLLLQGKMTNKLAYIEYKNTHLFKFVEAEEEVQEQAQQLQTYMRTRSKSGMKVQEQE